MPDLIRVILMVICLLSAPVSMLTIVWGLALLFEILHPAVWLGMCVSLAITFIGAASVIDRLRSLESRQQDDL
jgi:hypothetical protein